VPIDLNDPKFLNDQITKEDLFRKHTDYEIFKYYLRKFRNRGCYRSPLRMDDSNPSFSVFYSKQHGCLLFKDFAGYRGDCVRFVQYLLGLKSYQDAIERIAYDLDNSIPVPQKEYIAKLESKKSYVNIKIVHDDWKNSDISFWRSFHISISTLELFNVIPIRGFYLEDVYIETKGPAYAFIEYKDDIITYKIYRPFASKKNKWRTNHSFDVHQGYSQLPSTGELLIITKSLKDVMCLYETVRIPSIGIQSESTYIKESVLDEYRRRFDNIIILFDNDKQGIELANSYKEKYDLSYILLPEQYNSKDYSDLVKNYGKIFAVSILNKLLNINK